METLIRRVKSAIAAHGLIRPGEHVLLGVSGGADSVCLLHVLKALAPALDLRLTVAHLDHGIRGASSAADAAFVAGMARALGVGLVTARADVPGQARRGGLSLEMAARAARYAFFADGARRAGTSVAATAHTADDQAETVLLKLARGAGAGGLAGIGRSRRIAGLRVVRPLLDVTHREACAYLRSLGVPWREDETNRDVSFLRNRVRHDILPLLERKLNPGMRGSLIRAADVLSAEDDWLESICLSILAACRLPRAGRAEAGALSVSRLKQECLAARRRVLRLWLAEGGVPLERIDFDGIDRIEGLLACRGAGGRVPLGATWTARRCYDRLLLSAETSAVPRAFYRRPLACPGETLLPEQGLRVETCIAAGVEKPRGGAPGALPARSSISRAAAGRRRLYLRNWRPGDRMAPLGLRGTKKLQDIFVDAKVPAELRPDVPLLECRSALIWVPGYRVARGWEVRDAAQPAIQVRIERV